MNTATGWFAYNKPRIFVIKVNFPTFSDKYNSIKVVFFLFIRNGYLNENLFYTKYVR